MTAKRRTLVKHDGPGTIHETPNGYSAMGYDRALGHSRTLGTFPTLDEAQAAIVAMNAGTPPKHQGGNKDETGAKARSISKGIGRYLDEIEQGWGQGGYVSLGPNGTTNDPTAVDAHADKLAAKLAETTSPIQRLKLAQRVIDLRAAADELRERVDGASAEDYFVKHAAAWAEANGISYAAFRQLGVPAAVLKRAGVK